MTADKYEKEISARDKKVPTNYDGVVAQVYEKPSLGTRYGVNSVAIFYFLRMTHS